MGVKLVVCVPGVRVRGENGAIRRNDVAKLFKSNDQCGDEYWLLVTKGRERI